MTDAVPPETLARIRAGVMASILVCVVCRDTGLIVGDDGRPEWCDCARGEDMRDEAEWAAAMGHGEPPW